MTENQYVMVVNKKENINNINQHLDDILILKMLCRYLRYFYRISRSTKMFTKLSVPNIKLVAKFVIFQIMYRCNLYIYKDKDVLQFKTYIKRSFGNDALIILN